MNDEAEETSRDVQRHLWVSGRVQGVGFRRATFQRSQRFPGLRGYVQNLPDGRVEVVVAGPKPLVDELVEYCHRGPLLARVTDIEIAEEPFDPSLPPFEQRR